MGLEPDPTYLDDNLVLICRDLGLKLFAQPEL